MMVTFHPSLNCHKCIIEDDLDVLYMSWKATKSHGFIQK